MIISTRVWMFSGLKEKTFYELNEKTLMMLLFSNKLVLFARSYLIDTTIT